MGQLPSSQGVASWSQTCAELTLADYNRTCNSGFTNRDNLPWLAAGNTSCPTLTSVADAQLQGIWGVDKPTCDRVCGSDIIFQSFQFTTFASASANWLLPWLALSAQLPYEGEGIRHNAMSFFLGMGSPCLVALSIILTALNRVQIRKKFTYLIVEKARRIANSIPFFEDRLEAACELLQEAQQCPMRLSNKDGWLSSLILLPNNTRFWRSTLKYLRTTRRRTTPSLVTQLLLAIVTYFFTFFSIVTDPVSAGSTIVGLSLAFSSGFTWMLSIMMGVVFISSQLKVHAVRDALDEQEVDDRNYSSWRATGVGVFVRGLQGGIRSRSGLNNLIRWKPGYGPSRLGSPTNHTAYPPPPSPRPSLQGSPPSIRLQQAPVPQSPVQNGSLPYHTQHSSSMSDSQINSAAPLPPGAAMLRQRTATSSTGGSSASSTHGRAISQSHSLLNHRSPSPPPPQPNVPLLANEPFDTFWAPPVPKLWFWAIEGDEAKEGPAYNYARFFTQAQVQRQLLHGFTSTLRNLNAGYGAPSITVGGSPFEATPRLPLEEAMSGTTEQMAAFTHLPPESERDVPYLMAAYMGWRQMDSEMVLHMLVSLISGLIILWCAIGAGIYISYRTPLYGLGCRSGSLLLYGVLATFSCILLLVSSALSHDTMRAYQKIFREHCEDISAAFYDDQPWGRHDKTWSIRLRRGATVATRVLGKLVAIANAVWLITACIMELSGSFNTCYCQTVSLSLGERGSALIFVSQKDLAAASERIWIQGFVWSLAVPIAAAFGLATLAHKASSRRAD